MNASKARVKNWSKSILVIQVWNSIQFWVKLKTHLIQFNSLAKKNEFSSTPSSTKLALSQETTGGLMIIVQPKPTSTFLVSSITNPKIYFLCNVKHKSLNLAAILSCCSQPTLPNVLFFKIKHNQTSIVGLLVVYEYLIQ